MAPRAIGALLALVAALAFVVSIASSAWWAGHPRVDGQEWDKRHVRMGLLGATGCNTGGDGKCQDVETGSTVQTMGYVALAATGLATVLAFMLAVSAWTVGDRRKGVAKAVLLVSPIAAIAAIALLAIGPDIKAAQRIEVPIGWGTFVFGGAVVANMIAAAITRGLEPEPLRLKSSSAPMPQAAPDVRDILREQHDGLRSTAPRESVPLIGGAPQLRPLYDPSNEGFIPAPPTPSVPMQAPTPIPRHIANQLLGQVTPPPERVDPAREASGPPRSKQPSVPPAGSGSFSSAGSGSALPAVPSTLAAAIVPPPPRPAGTTGPPPPRTGSPSSAPPNRSGSPSVPPPNRSGSPSVPPPNRSGSPSAPPPNRKGSPTGAPKPLGPAANRAGIPSTPSPRSGSASAPPPLRAGSVSPTGRVIGGDADPFARTSLTNPGDPPAGAGRTRADSDPIEPPLPSGNARNSTEVRASTEPRPTQPRARTIAGPGTDPNARPVTDPAGRALLSDPAARPSHPTLAHTVPPPPTDDNLPPPAVLPAQAKRASTETDDRLETAMRKTEYIDAVDAAQTGEGKASPQKPTLTPSTKTTPGAGAYRAPATPHKSRSATEARTGQRPAQVSDTAPQALVARGGDGMSDDTAERDIAAPSDTAVQDVPPLPEMAEQIAAIRSAAAKSAAPIGDDTQTGLEPPPRPPVGGGGGPLSDTMDAQLRYSDSLAVAETLSAQIPAQGDADAGEDDGDEASDAGPLTDVIAVPDASALDALGDNTDPSRDTHSRNPGHTPIPTPIEKASSRPNSQLPLSTASASLPPPRATQAASGPTPACPQCEAPMAWVDEHLRFYCKQCRMYF